VIIQVTASGEGWWEEKGERTPVPPGHAFIAIVPEPSSYGYPPKGTNPWRFSWLNLYSPLALRLWSEFRQRFGAVLPLPVHSPAGLRHAALLGLLAKGADRWTISEAVYDFMLQWWRQLEVPRLAREEDPVAAAARLLQETFRTSMTIKELADQLGFSREHLSREFAARHGVGPAGFLRRLRVKAALDLMRATQLPLTEVALRTGFQRVRDLKRALASRNMNREGKAPKKLLRL